MTSTGYAAIHARLARERGPARENACSAPGCARQASVWAWLRTGPSRKDERYEWGTDLADYAAMCPSHERMLDRGGSLTHCPRGHNRAEAGVRPDNTCAACDRARDLDPERREKKRARQNRPEYLAHRREQYAAKKGAA